jgi:hypothetical protein
MAAASNALPGVTDGKRRAGVSISPSSFFTAGSYRLRCVLVHLERRAEALLAMLHLVCVIGT